MRKKAVLAVGKRQKKLCLGAVVGSGVWWGAVVVLGGGAVVKKWCGGKGGNGG